MKLNPLILLTLIIVLGINQILAQSAKQQVCNFEKSISITVSLNYLLYLPREYVENKQNWPLVLFLHGMGERGDDIEKVKMHGPPKLVNEGQEFPFILISPQCPDDEFWNVNSLGALLDDIIEKYDIDTDRVYVTGLSMGGQGTWALALAYPNRFAAIAPICGWVDVNKVCTISNMPIWVFHGAKDAVVPLKSSEQVVNKLRFCGSDVRFTVYPELSHDSWTETYNNDELYKWMLNQKKKR